MNTKKNKIMKKLVKILNIVFALMGKSKKNVENAKESVEISKHYPEIYGVKFENDFFQISVPMM